MSSSKWTPVMRQTFVTLPAILAKVGGGMSMGFTSAFLHAIKAPNSDIKMDLSTSSWFGSSIFIPGLLGSLCGSIMMSRYGRRPAFLVTALPAIIGLVTLHFAKDISIIFICRALNGFTIGSTPLIGIVTAGECASPQNRGMLLNMITLGMTIGSLLVHSIGYYVHWRTLTLIVAIPFTLALVFSYFWPESPSWLADQKQYEKSRQSFYWLRGENEESTREIEKLIRAQQQKVIVKTYKENVREFVGKFKKKNFLKPILLISVGIMLEEASGRHYFPSYSAQLTQEIVSGFSNVYYSMILDVIIVLSGAAAVYLIRVIKVRTLLFSSGSAAVIVLLLTSLSFYLVKAEIISKDYSPISLVLFCLFFVLSNLGCNYVPLALKGEIFPLEHKAVASLIAYIVTIFFMTMSTKTMLHLVAACQLHGAFTILAIVMAIMLIWMYFTLPETKNKSLQDIEDFFNYGKFIDGTVIPDEDDDIKC